MQQTKQLRRYGRIINKLSGNMKYVPTEELLDAAQGIMGEDERVTQRTLQRNIHEMAELFGIEIKHAPGKGYYISEYTTVASRYVQLLRDIEMLQLVEENKEFHDLIIPEESQMVFSVEIAPVIQAIRRRQVVSFDYTYFREDERVRRKTVRPYFLKESQGRWYLLGMDEDNKLKCFEMGRIADLRVHEKTFERDESIRAKELFKDCFGVWNDPEIPVEEIILRYDRLDGRFLRTLPIHPSQTIIQEDADGITIRLNLRITNDLRMELLRRSRSVEVIRPEHLRRELYEIYEKAAERNS